jgi:hypothetical protein
MQQWLDQMAQRHLTMGEQSRREKGRIKEQYDAMLEQALERQDEIAKQHEAMRKRAEERRAETEAEMQKLRGMSPEELRAYFIQKRQERMLERGGADWTASRAGPRWGQGPMGYPSGPGEGAFGGRQPYPGMPGPGQRGGAEGRYPGGVQSPQGFGPQGYPGAASPQGMKAPPQTAPRQPAYVGGPMGGR